MALATDTKFTNGAARLSKRIATIRANLQLPVLTREIGELLLRRTHDRFDQEVDPDGEPWRELAAATIIAKRRMGYGARGKLKRTGKLRDSIKLLRGNVAGSLYTNTGAGVRIGVEDPAVAKYGRVHQNSSRTVPRRRFLGIGRLDVKAVDSLLRRRGERAVAQS